MNCPTRLQITILFLMIPCLTLADQHATPQYYSENKGRLTLQNIRTEVPYQVEIKGKSEFNSLMVHVTRIGKTTRKYEMEKTRDEFSWTLPARDGKGPYQVIIFALMPDGRTYKGMATFNFTALQDYPKELANEAEERMSYYSAAKSGFRLETPPLTTDTPLVFRGMNRFHTVMIQVQKTGSPARQMRFQRTRDTNFSWVYHPKDGPGGYSITFFGNQDGSVNFTALVTYTQNVTLSPETNRVYPDLNKSILDFALASTNTTIGRGECWDLAAQALDQVHAEWARPFSFGRLVDPKKEPIYPGDILQMSSLKLVTRFSNGSVRTEYFGLPQHTAIVEKVIASNTYLMINQNVAGKRYVVRTVLDLNKLVSGKIDFYRPQPGLIRQEESSPAHFLQESIKSRR